MHTKTPLTVIAVPYWMMTVVRRHNKEPSVFLDFGALEKMFSFEDLTIFSHLNTNDLNDFIGVTNNIEFLWGGYFWNDAGLGNRDALTKEDKDKIDLISSVAYSDPAPDQTLKDRLFCVDNNSSYDTYPNPYEIYDIGRNVVIAVIYPGYFTGVFVDTKTTPEQVNTLFVFIRDLVQKALVYNSFDAVAATPLFERYMQLLSIKK